MKFIIACKGAPLVESIAFAETYGVGIEIKSFTSQLTYRSDWHGLLEVIKKQLNGFKAIKTLHGIVYVGPQSWDRMALNNLREENNKCLTVAQELKTDTLIIHSNHLPGLSTWKYKDWLKCQIDLIQELATKAREYNINIALENIIDSNPKSLLDVVEGVNMPNFNICLDFGHLNLIPSSLTPLEWIDTVEDRFAYTHIHNNNGRYDSHSPVENGSLDYEAIFLKLFSLKNPPKIAIEVDTIEGVKNSLQFIKNLIPKEMTIS